MYVKHVPEDILLHNEFRAAVSLKQTSSLSFKSKFGGVAITENALFVYRLPQSSKQSTIN